VAFVGAAIARGGGEMEKTQLRLGKESGYVSIPVCFLLVVDVAGGR
jgi:hypothetical protein